MHGDGELQEEVGREECLGRGWAGRGSCCDCRLCGSLKSGYGWWLQGRDCGGWVCDFGSDFECPMEKSRMLVTLFVKSGQIVTADVGGGWVGCRRDC
jgi:hypothetical protein